MQPNYFKRRLATVGRWLTTTLLCLLATVFVWQGAFSNISAMAAPGVNLIAAADTGEQVKDKTRDDAGSAKGFIDDVKDKVKETANKNAAKVDNATDDGSFVEGKAKRDRDRIEQRAEEDATRTKEAVDKTKNAVERTVDSIKDAFSK